MEKIRLQRFRTPDWRHKTPLPLVSLEDFFTENTDQNSIGCNLDAHPGLQFFYGVLCSIRSQPNVQDVLVEIYDIEGVENTKERWPFSQSVYILTSLPIPVVEQWTQMLLAQGPNEGYEQGVPQTAPKLQAEYKVWQVIWD